jgi:transglutaminase-like putative cysteine protease
MRRYRIVHTTTFTYPQPVRSSHNELRMTPLSEDRQTTLENRLRIRPMTWSHVYRDYFGTAVTVVESNQPHDRLEIEATSTVERPGLTTRTESISWADAADDRLHDLFSEWLMRTRRTEPGPGILELADSGRGAATPRAAAEGLADAIREAMVYERGVTGVHSSGEQAWQAGRGVCQDFAHIAVSAMRQVGIPARYVSGYLMPQSGAEVGESASGESHAWFEYWDGAWAALDPTNGTAVGTEHVIVARGREYEDVPPLKGVYSGGGRGDDAATLQVSVEVTRLA